LAFGAALAPGGNGSRSADQTNVSYWREIEGDFRATRMAAKGREAPISRRSLSGQKRKFNDRVRSAPERSCLDVFSRAH